MDVILISRLIIQSVSSDFLTMGGGRGCPIDSAFKRKAMSSYWLYASELTDWNNNYFIHFNLLIDFWQKYTYIYIIHFSCVKMCFRETVCRIIEPLMSSSPLPEGLVFRSSQIFPGALPQRWHCSQQGACL